MNRYTIQNQCQLLHPVTHSPLTGNRLFIGDTVAGEWYDTGNEELAPKIVKALNEYDALCKVAEAVEKQHANDLNAVRQHYEPIHKALKQLAAVRNWKAKP